MKQIEIPPLLSLVVDFFVVLGSSRHKNGKHAAAHVHCAWF